MLCLLGELGFCIQTENAVEFGPYTDEIHNSIRFLVERPGVLSILDCSTQMVLKYASGPLNAILVITVKFTKVTVKFG